MDAALPLGRLIEEFNHLLGARDFEGAEHLLLFSLGATVDGDSLLHFQLGKLYAQWNKLTSAMNHFTKAAELAKTAGNEVLLAQILDELSRARQSQQLQTP